MEKSEFIYFHSFIQANQHTADLKRIFFIRFILKLGVAFRSHICSPFDVSENLVFLLVLGELTSDTAINLPNLIRI